MHLPRYICIYIHPFLLFFWFRLIEVIKANTTDIHDQQGTQFTVAVWRPHWSLVQTAHACIRAHTHTRIHLDLLKRYRLQGVGRVRVDMIQVLFVWSSEQSFTNDLLAHLCSSSSLPEVPKVSETVMFGLLNHCRVHSHSHSHGAGHRHRHPSHVHAHAHSHHALVGSHWHPHHWLVGGHPHDHHSRVGRHSHSSTGVHHSIDRRSDCRGSKAHSRKSLWQHAGIGLAACNVFNKLHLTGLFQATHTHRICWQLLSVSLLMTKYKSCLLLQISYTASPYCTEPQLDKNGWASVKWASKD